MRTYLNTRYHDKTTAKALGAKWDPDFKRWYLEGDVTKPLPLPIEGSLDAPDTATITLYGTTRGATTCAVATRCSYQTSCPLLADGLCLGLNHRGKVCPHARPSQVRRRDNDHEFSKRVSAMSRYNQAKSPNDMRFALVAEGLAYLYTSFVKVVYDPLHDAEGIPGLRLEADDSFIIDRSWSSGGNNSFYAPTEALTPDVLAKILTQRPTNAGGWEIREFRERDVPRLLAEMRDAWPEGYAALEATHPKVAALRSDVGRTARLVTCAKGSSFETKDATWVLDGDRLVCRDYHGTSHALELAPGMRFLPEGTTIPVMPETLVEISDQSQVCETTEFVR